MKYKELTSEELKELEPEFVKYLASNSITADEWEKIKRHEPLRTSEMISHFSELIFESILKNIEFLEFRSSNRVIVFQCLPEKMISVVLEAPAELKTDFTNPQFFKETMENPPEGIKVYTAEKEYEQIRELELFDMTEKGCFPTDDTLFKALSLAL